MSPIYLLKGPSEQIYHCKPPPDHFKALNNFPENPGVIFESKCDILKEWDTNPHLHSKCFTMFANWFHVLKAVTQNFRAIYLHQSVEWRNGSTEIISCLW